MKGNRERKFSMSDSEGTILFPEEPKRVFIKSEKAYVRAKEAKFVREKPQPKRTEIKTPLTKEQKKYLADLITEWVTTSNLAKKPISYGEARNLLYDYGLDGVVNGIEQVEQSEFDQCVSYIQQRIRALESIGSNRVMRRKAGYRNSRIAAIHTRIKELGISDQQRREYQLHRYQKHSMKDLTDDEIDDYYGYVMHGTPKFRIPKKATPSIQQIREKSLAGLLDDLEAEAVAKGQQFNRMKLMQGRDEMLALLQQRDPALFKDIGDNFPEFWKGQKLGQCKSGVKPGKSDNR